MVFKDLIYESLYAKYAGTKFDSVTSFETYRDEILLIYKNKLDGTIQRYPHFFFHGEDGLINAYIILTYVFFEIKQVENFDEIYDFYKRGFFETYKINGIITYFGSLSNALNEIYGKNTFDLEAYLTKNKSGTNLKEYHEKTDKKEYYRNKLLDVLNEENISQEKIPEYVTSLFLSKHGLEYGERFFKGFFNYIDYVFPGIFKKEDIVKTNKTYDQFYNNIDTILKNENILINDITKSLLEKYGCYVKKGVHGVVNGIEDIKLNYCKIFNIPYYVIDYDKFYGKLQEYKFNYLAEISIKIEKTKGYIDGIIRKKSKIPFSVFLSICEKLQISFKQYAINLNELNE